MNHLGLTDKGVELVVALCQESGDLGREYSSSKLDETLYGFTQNHHPDDINDAASGDVAALVRLRTACGLPVLR